MNNDRLVNIPRKDLAKSAFKILLRLQDVPKEDQAAAIAAAFVVYIEHFDIDPQHLMTAVKNAIQADQRDGAEYFGALTDFVRHELV